jgi:hypothetical protein
VTEGHHKLASLKKIFISIKVPLIAPSFTFVLNMASEKVVGKYLRKSLLYFPENRKVMKRKVSNDK